MEKLVHKLRRDNPGFVFTAGEAHCWSPGHQQIFYTPGEEMSHVAGLLHELGHARLGHRTFLSDIDLLQKEIAAWEEALRLSKRYNVEITPGHVQDCLDSYRDWVYSRSRCPQCQSSGVQATTRQYHCLNCQMAWRVSGSRLHRSYRLRTTKK